MDLTKLKLTEEEWEMLIDGVEQLKSKDMVNEMLGSLMETMLLAPKDDATEEEKQKWEERGRMKRLDAQMKEDKEKEYKNKVEMLKAKLVLMK